MKAQLEKTGFRKREGGEEQRREFSGGGGWIGSTLLRPWRLKGGSERSQDWVTCKLWKSFEKAACKEQRIPHWGDYRRTVGWRNMLLGTDLYPGIPWEREDWVHFSVSRIDQGQSACTRQSWAFMLISISNYLHSLAQNKLALMQFISTMIYNDLWCIVSVRMSSPQG